MNKNILVEVCAGSLEDCLVAEKAGADRIELNNGIHLGGLTPSLATLTEAKKITDIPLIAMVRPRGAGFHYNEIEKSMMYEDAKFLIEHGADGLVFGFLNKDHSVDRETTKKFVDLCHSFEREAVFHRAFDCVKNFYQAIEVLISLGVDRILTSGLQDSGEKGIPLLKELQAKYGEAIELVVGAGVNESNANKIIEETKINQVHASFKEWFSDPTTTGEHVSYSYSDAGDYEGVGLDKLTKFIKVLK